MERMRAGKYVAELGDVSQLLYIRDDVFIIQRIYTGEICIQSFKYLCLLLPGGNFFPKLKTEELQHLVYKK